MRSIMNRNSINRKLSRFCIVKKSMTMTQSPIITAKEYAIHGNIPGTVEDNFLEISRDLVGV